jgi:hypothetical protein
MGLSALQYMLAAGAVANVLDISFDIGKRAVIIWSCEYKFHHLAWSRAIIAPHFFAWLELRLAAKRESRFLNFLKSGTPPCNI